MAAAIKATKATKAKAKKATKGKKAPAATTVWAWEDDPMSTGAVPIERPVPTFPRARMKLAFDAPQPAPGRYEPGTPEFRWWVAAEALVRAVNFWQPLLPPRSTWQRGDELAIRLDFGDKLNAFYNRQSLTFFHADIAGQTVYTGESPDVLAHECGHAILDILRPQLWDAMSHEVAALHESFGDCSAILTALQLPSMRTAVLTETDGVLYRSSRVSRVAEQLGWGARHRTPCAGDAGALRDAVSCFFYDTPERLPIRAPAAVLSSEPHSYSRVFTSAFLLTLGGMMITNSPEPDPDALQQACFDAGKLLVGGIQMAPITPAYLTQVAINIVAADQQLFDGKYFDAIQNGFVSRGLMAFSDAPTAAAAVALQAPRRVATEDLPTLVLSGRDIGLGDRPLLCQAPSEPPRLAATGIARDGGRAAPPSAEAAARGFLRELVARDRLVLPQRRRPDERLRTHEIVEDGDALRVVRRYFDAGLPWVGGRPGD